MVSVSERECKTLAPILSNHLNSKNLQVEIEPFYVKKSEVAKIDANIAADVDGILVAHRCEGRVLLTDKNGLYTNLISQLIDQRSSVL